MTIGIGGVTRVPRGCFLERMLGYWGRFLELTTTMYIYSVMDLALYDYSLLIVNAVTISPVNTKYACRRVAYFHEQASTLSQDQTCNLHLGSFPEEKQGQHPMPRRFHV